MIHKAWCSIEEVPFYFSRSYIKFQGHTGWNRWFESNLSKITRPVAAIKSLRFALFTYTVWGNWNWLNLSFGCPFFELSKITRPTLERQRTLGHLRSINPNMINHYANQSQTCQLLKISKNIFFSNKENVKSGAINLRLNWYRKSISIIERSYIYIYIDVEFLASHFNDLTKFTG